MKVVASDDIRIVFTDPREEDVQQRSLIGQRHERPRKLGLGNRGGQIVRELRRESWTCVMVVPNGGHSTLIQLQAPPPRSQSEGAARPVSYLRWPRERARQGSAAGFWTFRRSGRRRTLHGAPTPRRRRPQRKTRAERSAAASVSDALFFGSDLLTSGGAGGASVAPGDSCCRDLGRPHLQPSGPHETPLEHELLQDRGGRSENLLNRASFPSPGPRIRIIRRRRELGAVLDLEVLFLAPRDPRIAEGVLAHDRLALELLARQVLGDAAGHEHVRELLVDLRHARAHGAAHFVDFVRHRRQHQERPHDVAHHDAAGRVSPLLSQVHLAEEVDLTLVLLSVHPPEVQVLVLRHVVGVVRLGLLLVQKPLCIRGGKRPTVGAIRLHARHHRLALQPEGHVRQILAHSSNVGLRHRRLALGRRAIRFGLLDGGLGGGRGAQLLGAERGEPGRRSRRRPLRLGLDSGLPGRLVLGRAPGFILGLHRRSLGNCLGGGVLGRKVLVVERRRVVVRCLVFPCRLRIPFRFRFRFHVHGVVLFPLDTFPVTVPALLLLPRGLGGRVVHQIVEERIHVQRRHLGLPRLASGGGGRLGPDDGIAFLHELPQACALLDLVVSSLVELLGALQRLAVDEAAVGRLPLLLLRQVLVEMLFSVVVVAKVLLVHHEVRVASLLDSATVLILVHLVEDAVLSRQFLVQHIQAARVASFQGAQLCQRLALRRRLGSPPHLALG
eukprot:scaffold286_cov247-Pinguiococcus_pyrenoidosus.AAC.5